MFKKDYQTSYSQCGEDCIINFLRNVLELQPFTYLDIGANHPFKMSNTAMFYKMDFRGVLVEPEPLLYRQLKKKRKHDKVLNCGITQTPSEGLDFYLLDPPSLNTFSKEDALRYSKMGHKIRKIIHIPCLTVMDIINKYFDSPPTLISIDCEGLDIQILKSIDYSTVRPEIICIETIEYRNDMTGEKIPEIPLFMEKMGYFVFADTFINTIFLDKNKWKPK